MKSKIIFILVLFGLLNVSVFAQRSKITSKEFQQILGKWNGKLTYLDYQSNKPYEMPADLEILQIGNSNKFRFINSYPNESSVNSIDTVAINDNGKKIDNEFIKSKRKLSDGSLEVITEIPGTDGNDNKPALIRHTYLIGKEKFEVKKEVRFTGTTDWILRHTYTYTR